jgi:hypothetical protein
MSAPTKPTLRVMPNKCFRTRIEIEGKSYRAVSFFHEHPSAVPEDQWTVLNRDGSTVLVDKLTLSVMAECECEFLTREVDNGSSEPTIVSIGLTTREQIDTIK